MSTSAALRALRMGTMVQAIASFHYDSARKLRAKAVRKEISGEVAMGSVKRAASHEYKQKGERRTEVKLPS